MKWVGIQKEAFAELDNMAEQSQKWHHKKDKLTFAQMAKLISAYVEVPADVHHSHIQGVFDEESLGTGRKSKLMKWKVQEPQSHSWGGEHSVIIHITSHEELSHAHLLQQTWLQDLLICRLMVPTIKNTFLMSTLMTNKQVLLALFE